MMLFELMTGRVNTVSIKLKETPSRMWSTSRYN
jgi:hypothetical protein